MKTAVLLLNFGGPEKIGDVWKFLYRLFSDPDILVGIPAPLRQIVAFLIATIKAPSTRRNYAMIGGGSPQLLWTRKQAESLAQHLAGEFSEVQVRVAMKSSSPDIPTALAELRAWGAERVIALPLFPQFSTTTTGTCLRELNRALNAMNWKPMLAEIRSWPDHPDYVKLVRESVDEAIGSAGEEGVHVLFSAHSLPMKTIARGDTYPQEIERTIQAVSRELRHPSSLAFQSRNGPIPWLRPYVEEEIERLARTGVRKLVVVPVSFVSDHIETLYELDILYRELAERHGIETFVRTRMFNDHPAFTRFLADAVLEKTRDRLA